MGSMKKVAVTGGAGFIGSHLAEALAKRCYRVIIIDAFSTERMEHTELLASKRNVEFVHGSITDLRLLSRLFRGIHYVFAIQLGGWVGGDNKWSQPCGIA